MKSGQLPDDDDEVVLDWVMAEEHGLKVGDTLNILDDEFTIVGLSDGTNSWMASFFFVTRPAAEQLLLTTGRTSFVLLTLDADANAEEVEARLDTLNPTVRLVPKQAMWTGIPMIDVFNSLVESQKIPIFSVAGEPYNELLARIGIQADADIVVFGGLGLIFVLSSLSSANPPVTNMSHMSK